MPKPRGVRASAWPAATSDHTSTEIDRPILVPKRSSRRPATIMPTAYDTWNAITMRP